MSIFEAIILGIVQGLTEFLPVSSSGHILLLQKIFGIQEANLFFTVMLHVGTLIAVILVFHKDIIAIFKNPLGKMLRYLIIATIPAVVFSLLFKNVIRAAEDGSLLGLCFILTGLILLIAERFPKRKKTLEDMNFKHPIIIGLMQALGILQGISRSGSTIAGALFLGLDRRFAAKFSFLMSIPAILGGLIFEGKDAIEAGLDNLPWLAIIVGVIVAFISGLFAIKFMLKILTKGSLNGFAIYVSVLGVLVLLDQFVFHLCFANPFI